jgi:hypothetical protein
MVDQSQGSLMSLLKQFEEYSLKPNKVNKKMLGKMEGTEKVP